MSSLFIIIFREWKFEHQEHMSNISTPIALRMKDSNPMNYSVRLVRVGEKSLFSRDVLYSLVLSNVLSILIGAGIG
jgi:BCL2/adenovirus E1B 19 kDa protein-interacting protein 3